MGMTETQTLDDAVGTRATQRTLDADVRRELRRGETFAVILPSRLWPLLDSIVAEGGIEEQALLEATGRSGVLRRRLAKRHIEQLCTLGYVRRLGARLVPTVSGIGAVRPFVSLQLGGSTLQKLRELRRGEISGSATALTAAGGAS